MLVCELMTYTAVSATVRLPAVVVLQYTDLRLTEIADCSAGHHGVADSDIPDIGRAPLLEKLLEDRKQTLTIIFH